MADHRYDLEDLFEGRWERRLDKSKSIKAWLEEDDKGEKVRTANPDLVRVMQDIEDLKKGVPGANNFTKLKELDKKNEDLSPPGKFTLGGLQDRFENEIKDRRQEIVELLAQGRKEKLEVQRQGLRNFALEEYSLKDYTAGKQYQKVSSFADFYALTNEEATERLKEIGLEVEDGRITR